MSEPPRGKLKKLLSSLPGRTSLRNQFGSCLRSWVRIFFQAFQEKRFLVSEGGIEARRGNAHGLGEFRDGCGLVTCPPELQLGRMQRLITIERERPS